MRGPEQDATAPLIGAPRRIGDFLAMCLQPAPHDLLGDRRTLRARRDAGEIAEPGEALQIFGEGRRPARLGEIELGDRPLFAAEVDHAVEQAVAAMDVAEKGIVGHCDELERMASAQPHSVERRAPGQALEAFGDALGKAEATITAGADEPFAFLDSVGAGPGR